MGVLGRLGNFVEGGALGAIIGGAVGLLAAPRSGAETQARLQARVRAARAAGAAAQAAKHEELIRKFRVEVNDPDALAPAEAEAQSNMPVVTLPAG